MAPSVTKSSLALLVPLLVTATAAAQASVTLPSVKDTTLYEDPTGMLANGSGGAVFAGLTGNGDTRRALLQFNLAGAIPAGAIVLRAELFLWVTGTSATTPTAATLHRVTASWQEGSAVAPGGGGAGAPAVAGETTWLHRDFPNVFWTNPGGDFDPTPSATFDLPTPGNSVELAPNSGMVADIEGWLANPASNFGWLLKTDEMVASTARRFDSREAPFMRPALIVSYLLPGEAGLFGDGCPVSGPPSFGFGLGVATGPATGGTTLPVIYIDGPPNSVGAVYFSLGLNRDGVEVFSGCSVYLPGSQIVPGDMFMTSASGFGTGSFTVPLNSPGFIVSMQAAAIDASPVGYTLTNAGVVRTL